MTPPIRIIGIPMDLGQKRRGVDMGPSAIRYAGLQARLERLGYSVLEGGNVAVPEMEEISADGHGDDNAYNAPTIARVCQDIYAAGTRAFDAGETVIFLGGDHSMSLGSVSAALDRPLRTGVIWVDAHGDFNTPETTPSGNVHGMVVAALIGRCAPPLRIGNTQLEPELTAMIGIRDLDAQEKVALSDSGIFVHTMRDIDEEGMADVVQDVLRQFRGVDAIHVSLDMDSLDPSAAAGVGTPVPGGLTYREAHLIMEMLADDGRVRSLDVVEINPILDTGNRTAEVAVELVASLFGQRIL
ncbi:MAG: arginase [Anaerolineae bacterium]